MPASKASASIPIQFYTLHGSSKYSSSKYSSSEHISSKHGSSKHSSSVLNPLYSILVEIKHGLKQLYQLEQKKCIDLGAEPISAFERIKLLEILGKGEINITLSSLGESKIYETAYSGVWVVEHRNEQGQITSQFIEVTKIPDIVLSQMDDESTSNENIQALIDSI